VSDARPDPDALLRATPEEGRGRLKVFLGAAPGVGKTYEMLSEGKARLKAGSDVVIGIVETHGRAETEALVHGLEIVPRRRIDHQGHALTEMDIDAILERRPQLVLVDELAHTNVGGGRHPKRYQDVEELLDAGIHVYSTVNIQHIESLNDVVASFTRVRVRETIPDRVLERAEIEVVDIPPDELIERLKEGKVYIPAEATRALGHFFSKSNLSALRELALRRAAQAVDAQMLDYVRGHALAGTWAGSERVVVAVSELADGETLVRAAKRIADALHAPWSAVHVETPRGRHFGDADRKRIAAVLHLASRLGGTVATVPAASVIEGLETHMAEARATQLIVGKSARSRWFELRHGSIVDRLVREMPDVAIHVLPSRESVRPAARRRIELAGFRFDRSWPLTLLMVAGITGIGLALSRVLALGNVALLYLLPVMAAASLYGLWPGVFAGVASSLAYNFFFLPPTGSLTVSNPENIVSLLVLLMVAIVTSQFASRARVQADLAGASARQNAAIAGFARQLTAAHTIDELMQAICAELHRLLDVRAVLLLPSGGSARLAAANPPEDRLATIELAAATWALDKGQPAGRGSDTLTASDWLFQPLRVGDRTLAVIGVARDDGSDPVRSDQLPLLMSLIDQAALALERAQLEVEMFEMEQLRDRDRLREALLSSVSHDLRTPITSILGAVAELREQSSPLAPSPLVETIGGDAARLNRFVANLLDMARVEAGAIRLAIEATDLTDAIASAVQDTRRTLAGHEIVLDVSPGLPLVRVDPQLFHHILINLLDNAGRYAEPGTPITLSARRSYDRLILSVIDEGTGIPAGRETEIFETFRRIEGSDRAKGGTGLGLAIVKGFAEAMGMTVDAANRDDGQGAVFRLHFPDALLVRPPDEDRL
jgi:two-component system, OmpR family, sensor histidine kinase KdpD